MKVSKVDQVLPFVNQQQLDAANGRIQNLDGAIQRALEMYRGYSFAGNVKKAEYFGRVVTRLKEIHSNEVVLRDDEHLIGLHCLKSKVSRESVNLGMLLEQQKGISKGQIAPLQVRVLQVLCLKGLVVLADDGRVPESHIVVANRIATMWLSGELKLVEVPPVAMSAEQHYYEDYARGY